MLFIFSPDSIPLSNITEIRRPPRGKTLMPRESCDYVFFGQLLPTLERLESLVRGECTTRRNRNRGRRRYGYGNSRRRRYGRCFLSFLICGEFVCRAYDAWYYLKKEQVRSYRAHADKNRVVEDGAYFHSTHTSKQPPLLGRLFA